MDIKFQGYIQAMFHNTVLICFFFVLFCFVLAVSLSTNMCNNADFSVLFSIEREEE